MAAILKGGVRWASLETTAQVIGHEQGNSRPVVIMSNSRFNANTQLVIATLATSRPQPRNSPVSIPVQSIQMPQPSWILARQMRTLSAQRIGELLGILSADELTRVYRTVNRIFGVV